MFCAIPCQVRLRGAAAENRYKIVFVYERACHYVLDESVDALYLQCDHSGMWRVKDTRSNERF